MSELHQLAGDLVRTNTNEGVRVSARIPPVLAERLSRYFVDPDTTETQSYRPEEPNPLVPRSSDDGSSSTTVVSGAQ